MCGIAGFIGLSKNYDLTHKIMSHVFDGLDSRGEDASGFWGTEHGEDGCVVYHKEPIKSSLFVKTQNWVDLKDINLDVLIVHSRSASAGTGSSYDNKNNHPFVSSCKTIGLVHNGRIQESDYNQLKRKYEVNGLCDSELLLRMFDGAADKLSGLKDIWSFAENTHMAVAIGDRQDDFNKTLWLFRNEHRTLYLFDMRNQLGQIFFCSTIEIWREAIENAGLCKVFPKIKMINLPKEEIWSLSIDENNPVVVKDNLKKYVVSSIGSQAWDVTKEAVVPVQKKSQQVRLITGLDNEERSLTYNPMPINNFYMVNEPWLNESVLVSDIQSTCADLSGLITRINYLMITNIDTMSQVKTSDTMDILEQIKCQLNGLIRIIQN